VVIFDFFASDQSDKAPKAWGCSQITLSIIVGLPLTDISDDYLYLDRGIYWIVFALEAFIYNE